MEFLTGFAGGFLTGVCVVGVCVILAIYLSPDGTDGYTPIQNRDGHPLPPPRQE